MALLYERSALWRTIVSATRNPRILALFTVSAVGGGYAIGKGSQVATSGATERTKEEIEEKVRRDAEAARYASHSKNALAVMFDNIKPRDASTGDDPNAKYRKNPIKLPGVAWHPKVAQKEKEEPVRAPKSRQRD